MLSSPLPVFGHWLTIAEASAKPLLGGWYDPVTASPASTTATTRWTISPPVSGTSAMSSARTQYPDRFL
ncbi:hypothetical protein [Sphingomonas sp. HMP6]|uniref:hypothetical protein n=1 Tax=Sphingomonas sp. HMP6 TaxID=1517551 RepID=UPI001E4902D2|nr:hypothetical protein [Sphingomonas sp. HMP6]